MLLPSAVKKPAKRLKQRITTSIELAASRSTNVDSVKTVCLALGPYRNLTTLTAAVPFLHPKCQVFNHGGNRVFGDSRLDFLAHRNPKALNRFVRYAAYVSQGTKGQRGSHGGSIVHSHAFDAQHDMQGQLGEAAAYAPKRNIESLFWKESLKTSNYIRAHQVDLREVLSRNPRLRFLMPIRNPMDCARSNVKEGHVRFFEGLDRNAGEVETCGAVLREILWFLELHRNHPDRFFYFFENDISRAMLVDLAAFLQLEPTDAWLDHAMGAMKSKRHYRHGDELTTFYLEKVEQNFAEFPGVAKKLQYFAGSAA